MAGDKDQAAGQMRRICLTQGDCGYFLKKIPTGSIDAIVTDPPYGIKFMSKKWDYDIPSIDIWAECLRVLRPGGHALVACGTRTQHRMVVNLEDAGFEIREILAWVYGSGMPKSLDVSKAIDKHFHAPRTPLAVSPNDRPKSQVKNGKGFDRSLPNDTHETIHITAPATPQAQEWDGWGTGLTPSMEMWTLCRKPISESNVATNVLKHGTGAINIDACRIEDQGRWPKNLIHDGSEEVTALFPDTGKGNGKKPYNYAGREYDNKDTSMFNGDKPQAPSNYNDSGSASRFFYVAKASKRERNLGLEDFTPKRTDEDYRPNDDGNKGLQSRLHGATVKGQNSHPTIKPMALMQYLCKLITPPNGVVLDPYMGSGSTGMAAILGGFKFNGIELDEEYFDIAEARIAYIESSISN